MTTKTAVATGDGDEFELSEVEYTQLHRVIFSDADLFLEWLLLRDAINQAARYLNSRRPEPGR